MSSVRIGEQRAIVRLPCNISISNGQSAPMGTLSDISLDGAFVTTSNPLPLGTVVPVSFEVGEKGETIRPTVEVARVTPHGMGLRFSSTSPQDVRRLRRYIAELANIVSNRQAAELLARAPVGDAKPFTDPEKIRNMLESNAGRVLFTIIAQNRSQRQRLHLSKAEGDALVFYLKEQVDLRAGETVLGLYTQDYTSFSFESVVTKVTANLLEIALPASLSYSERRTSQREHAQGATLSIDLPWRPGETRTWPVFEQTERGMSFLVEADQGYLWPGIEIPAMTLKTGTTQETIHNATVKHLSAYQSDEGKAWVRVGVSLPKAQDVGTISEALSHEGKSQSMARRWGRDLSTKLSYLFYKTMQKVSPASQDGLPTVVQFNNTRRQKVVGLLSLTARDPKKQRMPMVLMAPGFGARKETMSALALAIVEAFRRQNKDVAVLRFDGTNSIGESYKDPGCESDGREHLRYCVSGGVSDILGAIQWAKSNPFVEATDVIMLSVSFSSIATRHAMTLPELSHIRQWICFMGAPDAQNAIMNIGGNVDAYAMHLAGIQLGTPSLLGCLVDADLVCSDMHALKVATLEDARREMAKVKADITWFIGKNDAFMDAARVRDIMSVKATGKRQIIEVNAGHVPQSSAEAFSEFALIARQIFRGLHGVDVPAYMPPIGKVGVVHQWEWARIRKTHIGSHEKYWKNYLLGGNTGLGYDVWCLTPEYQQLLNDTAALASVAGKEVLDLGAGTGNLTLKMLEQRPSSLTALDLVPEAMDALRKKVAERGNVACVVASADGSCRVAMRRWLAGDLPDFNSLIQTLPVSLREQFDEVRDHYTPQIHAYLRGAEIPYTAAAKSGSLSMATARALMNLRVLLENAQGRLSDEAARSKIDPDFLPILSESPGLPFESNSFDVVVSSLVLSYMTRIEDVLFEAQRVLRPGGTFVASTLMPDVDTSQAFMNAIKRYESANASELPEGYTKEQILAAMREFVDRGAGLLRLQEEGQFRFWSPEDFGSLLTVAGFEGVSTTMSLGVPPQGAIAIGKKRQQND